MTAPQSVAVTALLAAVAALQLPVLPPPALCLGITLGLLLLSPGRQRGLVLTSGLAVLAVLLQARQWQDRLLPRSCEREQVELRGEVTGLVSRLSSDRGPIYSFDLRTREIVPARCAGPTQIRLYLHAADESSVSVIPVVGDRLRAAARLRRPQGYMNPGAEEGERQALLKGLHAVGSVSSQGIEVLGKSQGPAASLGRLRERLSQALRDRVPGAAGGLAAALTVGDQRYISDEGWHRLRGFGLTHLMVISGLHITLLAAPGWWLGARLAGLSLRRSGSSDARHLLPPLFALGPAVAYALLAGLSLPTQRALIIISIAVVPRLCGRRLDRARLLAAGALLLFCLDPVSVIGASFCLSVSAVAVLLWFSAWQGGTRAGKLRGLVRVQLLMLAAMFPISLFWFQSASGIGGLLNLVAIPLITLWVVPCLLLGLLPLACNSALADPLLLIGSWPLRMLWRAMGYWADELQPLGIVDIPPTTVALLGTGFAALCMALPRFRFRRRLGIALLVPLCLPAARPPSDDLQILVLDVGQGTSVLVRSPSTSLLYDTGGGVAGGPPIALRTVLPALRHAGVDSIDMLIISHPDLDHDAGEPVVRENFQVREIRRGRSQSADERTCRMGEHRQLGTGIELQFLSGDLPGDSDNNASCVVRVQAYGRTLLLPGDIDSQRERELLAYWGQALRADLVLAGHHGSAGSNSRLWLRSLDPALLIVSAARANRFGHPAERVRATAESLRVPLLNTAHSGAITLRIAPDGRISCRRLRHTWQAFWRRGDHPRNCARR